MVRCVQALTPELVATIKKRLRFEVSPRYVCIATVNHFVRRGS